MDAQNLFHSRMIVLWGANISVTRFGSELENVLREIKKRGVPIICIDPRRSLTVKQLADEWIPIFPGTDTAMMAAVLCVLIEEGFIDENRLGRYSKGYENLRNYIFGTTDGQRKDPVWAAALCGVPASQIAGFARGYGSAKPTALIPGLSIQRNIGGEEAIRMSVALQTATGNIGVPGGSSGSNIWSRLPGPRMSSISSSCTGDDSNLCLRDVPVCRWPDAVIEGKSGESEIKCLYTIGGNYLSTGE